MPGKILNCLVSAVVGAASAVGTVWFLTVRGETSQFLSESGEVATKVSSLEVGSLKIVDALVVVDPATGEPTIELRGDSIFVQKGVYAEQVGAFRVVGQKIQATPDNPLDEKSPIFCELATNEDGGAYVALLSPRESHSVTIGFDKTEKGCVLSQNNDDSSMVAQAIFLKPVAQDAASENGASTGGSETVGASKPVALEENGVEETPEIAASAENFPESEIAPPTENISESEIAPPTENIPESEIAPPTENISESEIAPLDAGELPPFPSFEPNFGSEDAGIGETL